MTSFTTRATGGAKSGLRLTAAGLMLATALIAAPPVQAGNSGTIVCLLSVITGQVNQEQLLAATDFSLPRLVPSGPEYLPGLSGPAYPGMLPPVRLQPAPRELAITSLQERTAVE